MKHCATCRCVVDKRPASTMQKALGPRAQAWIMDYLLAQDGWQTVKQIAAGTGKNAGTIRRGLDRLVLARFVEKIKTAGSAHYKVENRAGWLKLLGVAP